MFGKWRYTDKSCFVVPTILAIGLVVGKGAVYGPESRKNFALLIVSLFVGLFA